MSSVEYTSVALAGTPVNYAYAAKAGPWIFLNGHEAYDFASGLVAPEVEGPAGYPTYGLPRFRREGDYLLSRFTEILSGYGSDFSQSVRLDQYYPSPAPVDPYHLARKAVFGGYIPPSTSVVMERCFNAATSISSSIIATEKRPDYAIQRYSPTGLAAPSWSGFASAISCSDFVFVAGQTPNDGNGALDPSAHVPDHARWGGSEIRKQTEYLITKRLKTALDAAGSSFEQVLKAQVYIEGIENIPEFYDVWNSHFAGIPCALTVVPTKSFALVGCLIEINLIALRNDSKRKKELIVADIPGIATCGACVKAGELLFPSAMMAIAADGTVPGAGLDGIAAAGATQAALIYDYAQKLCAAASTSMTNVLRAQYFMPDLAEFAGVSLAWNAAFGSQPHPFICIGTPTRLPAPKAAMLADFWIYAP